MDKQSVLDEIFSNDPFGLQNVKPANTSRNADERLLTSFEELNTFFEKHNREPQQGSGVQEHVLYARLKSLRESPTKMEMLKSHDRFGLLIYEEKEINSLSGQLDMSKLPTGNYLLKIKTDNGESTIKLVKN